MKIFFLIGILMFFSCITRKAVDQITGDCTLVEVTNIKGSCGVTSLWIGMKFKEIKTNLEFIGLVHCPDFYIVENQDFFTLAKIYEIEAKRPLDIPKGDVVLNEYDTSKLIVYRIDEIKKR